MPRGETRNLQVSFSGGELSPEMWSRHDDARFRSGVARMRNMVTHPHGTADRRPGFQHVREVKADALAVRLLPFRFSREQTVAIEMGVTPDTGYFRFHTDGGTVLHPLPPAYVAPRSVDAIINITTNVWNVGADQEFQTGDPIVITMEATTRVVTVNIALNKFDELSHGFENDEAVLFRTTINLPQVGPYPATGGTRLKAGRIYYVRDSVLDSFKIALTRGGTVIDLTSAEAGSVIKVACLPEPLDAAGDPFPFDCNRTYYAIDALGAGDIIGIAATRADAEAGTKLDFISTGTSFDGDLRVHYDYRNGSVVESGAKPYYCRKTPWGFENAGFVNLNDHLEDGHGPAGPAEYWVVMSGSTLAVTFDLGTDEVIWAAHALTDGDPVTFTTTATLPTGITAGTVYYVRDGTAGRFKIAASLPGPLIDLTGTPSGTHTAFANGFYEVPHDYAADVLFEVNIVQSNDVLTLVHPTRPAAELRRLGATDWRRADVAFRALVAAPTGVDVVPFAGEGLLVTAVTAATPAVITTGVLGHLLGPGDKVQVVDVGDIPDGHYIVDAAPVLTTLLLKTFETGVWVSESTGALGAVPRVRRSGYVNDWEGTYAVSAIDVDDKESIVSEKASVSNNLFADGANNTITWVPVAGATRYLIYKEVNGLLGFIGEVDAPTTTFVDDSIAPDLSITPPLLDESLRVRSNVTFDTAADTVTWTAHGLEEGSPVIFRTDKTLPTGVDRDVTYFVANPSTDGFELRDGAGDLIDLIDPQAGIHLGVSGFWPAAVVYFEQRRVFGGATLRPQDFWMTASGTESELSYTIPVKDSNRIHVRLAARERSQLLHAVSLGHLMMLTSSAEFRITPLNNFALTPTSIAARAPTQIGVSTAMPIVVNNIVLFPAARGGHLREMGFLESVGDYVTGDVSLRASHLFDKFTLVQLAYHQAPYPVVWAVSSSGSLLGFSYVPEEELGGWHKHDIDGTFESCAVISEGNEDRLYVVTLREGTRYIERMGSQTFTTRTAAFFVDFGITYDGVAVSTLFVPHLASKTVTYLADGVIGTGTVTAAGVLTLATAASVVHVGLAYTSELRTLPVGLQIDAALGSARSRNVNNVWLRVDNSGAFLAGESLTSLARSDNPPAGQLTSGLVQVVTLGAWNLEGQIYVTQDEPLPLTISGLTLELALGG